MYCVWAELIGGRHIVTFVIFSNKLSVKNARRLSLLRGHQSVLLGYDYCKRSMACKQRNHVFNLAVLV